MAHWGDILSETEQLRAQEAEFLATVTAAKHEAEREVARLRAELVAVCDEMNSWRYRAIAAEAKIKNWQRT